MNNSSHNTRSWNWEECSTSVLSEFRYLSLFNSFGLQDEPVVTFLSDKRHELLLSKMATRKHFVEK